MTCCASVLSVVALTAAGNATGAPITTPTYVATLNASDTMSRTVSAGFGTANQGGSYATAPTSIFSVSGGAGHLSSVAPGSGATATLSLTPGADQRLLSAFTLPSLPRSGTGVFHQLQFRLQANSDAYRIQLLVAPGGRMTLAFSRIRNNVRTMIGSTFVVPQVAVAGKPITFEGMVAGSSTVQLRVRAWSASTTAAPPWQLGASDSAATRLTTAGKTGTRSYVSSTSPAAPIGIVGLLGWQLTAPGNPPPPPSSSQGSVPVGAANYSYPSTAVFVAPSGSDSASGTKLAPWRTLGAAIAKASSGTTIVLRAGTYREKAQIPKTKRLTIQSYPYEAVWLDGSDTVSAWTHSGSNWIHSGWTTQFDSTPNYGTVSNAPGFQFVNAQYPMAAHPDQIWIDGVAMRQMTSAAAVTAGTFYADYAAARLILGSSPTGHAVQVAARTVALVVQGPGSVIRGIGVRNYGTPVPQMASLRIEGAGSIVENVVVINSATTGLGIETTGVTVRHVTTSNNGMLGVHGNYADNVTIDGLLAENNNTEHFNTAPVSGGVKISRTRNIKFLNSLVQNNLGTGLWLDESCFNISIVNNRFLSNVKAGVEIEISSHAVVADNVIANSTKSNLKIVNTDYVRVWNNSIGYGPRNIEVLEDGRRASQLGTTGHDPRQPMPDPTVDWVANNVDLENNLLAQGTGSSGLYSLYLRDYSGQYSAAQMLGTIDANIVTKPTVSSSAEFVWGLGGSSLTLYTTTAAFYAGTSRGAHQSEGPILTWTQLISSPTGVSATATANARLLPADIAALVGQSTATRHIGAW